MENKKMSEDKEAVGAKSAYTSPWCDRMDEIYSLKLHQET
jgi:hypothetical protein